MEPLARIGRELLGRLGAMPAALRMLLLGGAGLLVLVLTGAALLGWGATYQYAFTNLTPEDSSEAAGALKGAGIPFRAEAGGSALAVPASKVHDARLLLAAQGLPRGAGVGFELFDRGDLGASEFTQRVNLRRATEGELARTISKLSAVRSARVHLTLPERGLFRDDDRKPSAAVVMNLQPGRSMSDRELAGVRHLVSSAVAGLEPEKVTIVDGRGTVLAGDRSESARLASQQREVEGALEARITELLEPAVGAGAIVAKVTATLDTSEVETTGEDFDPDRQVVRSERKTLEKIDNEAQAGGGVAGAAANQPLGAASGGGAGGGNRAQTSREDETRNFEIARKVTRTVNRAPRVTRLSAAVLVDGVDGKPRPEAEMRRLADLAKHAMGFDAQRGDRFDISSAPFTKVEGSGPTAIWARPEVSRLAGVGAGVLVALAAAFFLFSRARRPPSAAVQLLKPGASVAELEAALGGRALPAADARSDSSAALRDRARELGKGDPARAAHLMRAWVAADSDAGRSHG